MCELPFSDSPPTWPRLDQAEARSRAPSTSPVSVVGAQVPGPSSAALLGVSGSWVSSGSSSDLNQPGFAGSGLTCYATALSPEY